MTTVKNIYDYINSIAPYDTQEEWDNSGHLVGDFRKEVKKAVLALDATKAVCAFSADDLSEQPCRYDVVRYQPVFEGAAHHYAAGGAGYHRAVPHLCQP